MEAASHFILRVRSGASKHPSLKEALRGSMKVRLIPAVILEGSAQQAAGSGNAASPVEFCSGRTYGFK